MQYAYGYEDERTNWIVLRFVAQLIPHVDRGWPAGSQGIGVMSEDGQLIAGVVFYHWNKRNGTIEIAAGALPNVVWFTRETMRRALNYAFRRCRCQMVILRVRADDERTLGQLARFGFTFVAVPRLYGRADDGVLCTFTEDDWAGHRCNTRETMDEAAAA